jgi:protein-L-isoaspartate O-methyltransferase
MPDPDVIARMLRNEADMAYRRRVQTVFEWLDPQDTDDILDAGCGRGFYLNFIRQISQARLVGLELELPYLRLAQRALMNLSGIFLVSGSLYALFPLQPSTR